MKRRSYLLLLAALFGVAFMSYDPDIDVEELIPRYTYPDSAFVSVDGTSVHYRATGAASLPTLVLIHGVASSLHTWEGWHDRLSDAFHVVSFDVLPFGLTGPVPEMATAREPLIRFLHELFRALKIDRMYLAGNSYGGWLAWNYALAYPDQVDKLILVDSEGLSADTQNKVTHSNIGFRLATTPVLKHVSHVSTPTLVFRQSIEAVYGDAGQVTDEMVARYRDLMLRAGNRVAFSKTMQMLSTLPPGREQVRAVQQPTLILWGKNDRILPVSAAHLFHELLSNSTLHVYDGLGHVPMEEDSERTATDARAFLLYEP